MMTSGRAIEMIHQSAAAAAGTGGSPGDGGRCDSDGFHVASDHHRRHLADWKPLADDRSVSPDVHLNYSRSGDSRSSPSSRGRSADGIAAFLTTNQQINALYGAPLPSQIGPRACTAPPEMLHQLEHVAVFHLKHGVL